MKEDVKLLKTGIAYEWRSDVQFFNAIVHNGSDLFVRDEATLRAFKDFELRGVIENFPKFGHLLLPE